MTETYEFSRKARANRRGKSRRLARRRLYMEPLEDRRLLAVLFADSFEQGEWNGNWVEDSQNDWFTSTQRFTDGTYSAEVDGRATDATLTMANAVDLSGFDSAELTFDWYIESGFDNGEYLSLDVSSDGGANWQNDVRRLSGNIDTENTWHSETVDLTPYASSNVLVRFRSLVSHSDEDANVDNVQITGTSGPISYDGAVFNGHFYLLTSNVTDWATAENEAVALGGHLVAINSPEEQAFLNDTFLVGANETAPLWIGLTDQLVEGDFLWTTGESLGYTNWLGGEPNDNGTGEDYGTMNWGSTKGQWNDTPLAGTQSGQGALNNGPYIGIVEREAIGLAIDDVALLEGGDDTTTDFVFTVTRYGDLSASATVHWSTADETATSDIDFVAASGVLNFAIDDAEETITISVIGDTEIEDHEQFFLNLSNASGANVLVDQGVGTILNDDVSISISDVSVVEGDTSLRELDRFITDGSGGLARARQSTFGPDTNGDGENDLYVASADSNEILVYDGLTGAFIRPFASVFDPLDLAFNPVDGDLYVSSFDAYEVVRFDAQTGAHVDTPISGLAEKPFGLTFTSDGTLYIAQQESDEVLKYEAGQLTTFISGPELDGPRKVVLDGNGNLYVNNRTASEILKYDADGNFIEVFAELGLSTAAWVDLGTDGNLYATGRPTSVCCGTSIVVVDLDTGDVTDRLDLGRDGWSFMVGPDNVIYSSTNGPSNGNFIARIGTSSTATFEVQLSQASGALVSVDYTTASGTAIEGVDYTGVTGTLVFEPGVTSRTIILPTLDDGEIEGEETFTVTLTGAVGASIAAGQDVGTGTILDDDGVQIDPNTLYVYDISFDSRKGGRDWRAVFEIRSDSNADGQGDPLDARAVGVSITVEFEDQTYIGTTDSNGIFRTGWIRNLSSGDHYANAVDLVLSGYVWNHDLDLEDDSDGDGFPDDLPPL